MTMVGTGMRVDRVYTDPTSQARESERRDRTLLSTSSPFKRAVVVEIYNDPVNQLNDLERLQQDVRDVDVISKLPRGAILARIISGGSDRHDRRPHVFLPFYGPYFIPPVKVGEQVIVLYDDHTTVMNVGFWICRIPELCDVDDVNYTHADRRYEIYADVDTIDKLEQTYVDDKPRFLNGHPSGDSPTIGTEHDEYDRVVQAARASSEFACEAVPRFAHNPGDFLLQGSNNTLLCMTTNSILSGSATPGTGTIVISCGRGQTATTAPVTIVNTRDHLEVDKVPSLHGVSDNRDEGAIDCVSDLTTFVMSMRTDVDKLFNIDVPNGGEATIGESPAAGLKSTRLRFVGREDVKIQAGENGTGAAIILKASGDILLIPGPNGVIKLGGDDASTALLGNSGIAAGGSVIGQPIVSTMGGVVGHAQPHGMFGTKVVVS